MKYTLRDKSNELVKTKTFYGPYVNQNTPAMELPKHILVIAEMLNGRKISLNKTLKIFTAASRFLEKDFAVKIYAFSKKQESWSRYRGSTWENYIALEIKAKDKSGEKHFWKLISYF